MVKSDVQVVKIATQIARLHICISLLQVHGPTWHPPPQKACPTWSLVLVRGKAVTAAS